jgi:ATP-dependent Clp protease ATP-binding subunit ClpC
MIGLGVEPPEGELAFTGRAEDVLDRARREASVRDERMVGTEHILLALVHERSGAAARILLQLDADATDIRSALAS